MEVDAAGAGDLPPMCREMKRPSDVHSQDEENRGALDDFDTLVLVRDEIVAVVAPDHRCAGRHSVLAAELAHEPFLARAKASGTRAVAETALRRAGVRLQATLEVASTLSLKRAVLDGGFTLLSRLAVQVEERSGEIAVLTVTGADLRRQLRAVRLRRRRLTGDAGSFWAFLQAAAPGS